MILTTEAVLTLRLTRAQLSLTWGEASLGLGLLGGFRGVGLRGLGFRGFFPSHLV